uniref:Uncharacterized protein n=1 Tax=Branchiostoma floridae TaxID=7739 RepID=C3XQF2_BRAFL|eukprot:XP_002613756.1 hypothetical protein BRAFLDRAFT_84512 [Branchiostoma floridae]
MRLTAVLLVTALLSLALVTEAFDFYGECPDHCVQSQCHYEYGCFQCMQGFIAHFVDGSCARSKAAHTDSMRLAAVLLVTALLSLALVTEAFDFYGDRDDKAQQLHSRTLISRTQLSSGFGNPQPAELPPAEFSNMGLRQLFLALLI